MIPRVLHRIWIEGAIPAEFETYWQAWERLHPGWELRTWRDGDLGWLTNRAQYEMAVHAAQKADVARYDILARYGGVYVDCDVEPLRSLDDLLGYRAFAGYEDAYSVCNAVIGTEAGHGAICTIVAELPASMTSHRAESVNMQSGPPFITEILRRGWDGLMLLPPVAFYPYHWSEADPHIYPEAAYAVHHWAKSWL